MTGPDGQFQLHASTVAFGGLAVSIVGPAGTGKSGFALALMNRGATLVADDVTWFEEAGGTIIAKCPPSISGKIEARGMGILNAPVAGPTPLGLIVDLGCPETQRVPPHRTTDILGHEIRVLHTPENSYFIDAVAHYLMHGISLEHTYHRQPE